LAVDDINIFCHFFKKVAQKLRSDKFWDAPLGSLVPQTGHGLLRPPWADTLRVLSKIFQCALQGKRNRQKYWLNNLQFPTK
jgi:hypothetical protein